MRIVTLLLERKGFLQLPDLWMVFPKRGLKAPGPNSS